MNSLNTNNLANVKLAVAIDFGYQKDPLAPVWIHFHKINSLSDDYNNTSLPPNNAGTGDFDTVHSIHEDFGFGSMVTCSFQEYQYLLNVVELPVMYIKEHYLPQILPTISSYNNDDDEKMKYKCVMMTEDDEYNTNWIADERRTPNAYYRSYRLARQMEHLQKNLLTKKIHYIMMMMIIRNKLY